MRMSSRGGWMYDSGLEHTDYTVCSYIIAYNRRHCIRY